MSTLGTPFTTPPTRLALGGTQDAWYVREKMNDAIGNLNTAVRQLQTIVGLINGVATLLPHVSSGEIVSGSGTSWTLANTPSKGATSWLILAVQGSGGATILVEGLTPGYTISGNSITTTSSYSAGNLVAWYTYEST